MFMLIFIIGLQVEKLNSLTARKWVMEIWNNHLKEYCTRVRRNEVLTCTTTWVIEDNLSGRDQTQSPSNWNFYSQTFMQSLGKANICKERMLGCWVTKLGPGTESRLAVAWSGGCGSDHKWTYGLGFPTAFFFLACFISFLLSCFLS